MTVQALVDNIDKDIYCYETELNFGHDVAQSILGAVLEDETQFPRRHNYYAGDDYQELTRQIGARRTRELIRRQLQVRDRYPNMRKIDFRQYFFTDAWTQQLMATVPEWVRELAPGEPKPILQVSENGDLLPAHCGHQRKCSLMMILQEDAQETRWYRETQPFELIDPLRIPDLDCVEPVVSVTMKPWRWYMFNHKEWHSVHRFTAGTKRISIGIDFFSITGPELLSELKSREL